MMIWMILLAMTAAAVMAVLWPLSRHRAVFADEDPDTQFYREQIAEIERERERGLLLPAEAEAAKAEAGRRLLRAGASAETATYAVGEPALRRRRAVSTLALSLVPILALAIYGAYGSPHIATPPLAAKGGSMAGQGPGDQLDIAKAVAQIEAHLARSPGDGRGWDIIAPVYLRLGRVDDAVNAYASALRLLGRDAARLTDYGEALVLAQSGVVSKDAKSAFEDAVRLDPSSVKARFYLAQAAEQDGQVETARDAYASLLSSAPPDAPWAAVVREQLGRLGGVQSPAPAAGGLPDRDAITGMVEGLAARLDAKGGSAEEWTRLMRSYVVLGQRDKALSAARRARQALAQDATGLQRVDAMVQDLKLTDGARP